jgi:PIN domain nuclease of toxin-antitoxin system
VTLVDTHVVVWLAFHQDQLSRKARIAIDHARKNVAGLAVMRSVKGSATRNHIKLSLAAISAHIFKITR